MANDKIIIKGAKENNLKNIDLTIPRDKLVVMTGLSGSGTRLRQVQQHQSKDGDKGSQGTFLHDRIPPGCD